MHMASIFSLSEQLRDKKISSVALTQYYLSNIKRLNPTLNSFITVTEQQALQQALRADERIAKGQATALTGIPIAHKDLFCTQGVKTSCGSKMLDNFYAPYDSTVAKRCEDAGMVMLGKTNLDEFAMGSSNENSHYGPVKNPWNLEHVPGGSSGGSAAAVAADLCAAATGTDTGGSIRQPAAFCGITGLKPTYGRVSRFGMVSYASSLDQGGPMTRSARDAALMLQVLAGHDAKDSTSLNVPVPDYSENLARSLNGLKIGLPKEYVTQDLDSHVAQRLDACIAVLKKLGADMIDVELPHTHLAVPSYYVIALAECSSNLSRYDGVRYGYRCESPKDLEDLYKRSRGEAFSTEVKRRIMLGTYTLSAGYYDAYYLKAQKIRRLISQDFKQAFEKVDVLLGPTTPNTAFKLGEKTNDPISMYLQDVYTTAINLAGLPALALPAGQIDALPIGFQLIGNYLAEAQLLNIGHQFQSNTDYHLEGPAQ